jgi:hypothetical protein
MQIEKCRLPKGMSFVLRSSALGAALDAAGIHTQVSLKHVDAGVLLDAFFWPPRPSRPYECFYLRAGAVPSAEAHLVRRHVEAVVIPEFIAWGAGILALPTDSPIRRSEQTFFHLRPTGAGWDAGPAA